MKKIFIIISLTIFLLLPSFILADSENHDDESEHKVDPEHPTLKKILENIRNTQHIDKNKDIDCDKITSKQFLSLGESYMISQHPTEEHELLHEMIELNDNPESEKLMHTNLGHEYLNCPINYKTISGGTYNNEKSTTNDKKLINKDIIIGFAIGSVIFVILFKIISKKKKKSEY